MCRTDPSRPLLVMLALSTLSCATAPRPPAAAARPHPFTQHGHTRIDDYHWLRDDSRKDPAVLAHLRAENAYAEAVLRPTLPLQERLYRELTGRLKQDDDSVPFEKDGYWYYTRYDTGREYFLLARKRGSLEAPEEILLDVNELRAGRDYLGFGEWQTSRGGGLLAFSFDDLGRYRYSIRVKDLRTGQLLPDRIENTSGEIAWANDERTLFYVEKDPVTLREHRVRRHTLGIDPAADPVVHEEADGAYYVYLSKSRSGRFVVIDLWSTLATEVRLVPADRPLDPAWVFTPRARGHEYAVEDQGDRFLVRTNWQAKNFRIVEAAAGAIADRDAWRDVVPHRDDTYVESFRAFRDHLAVLERSGGLRRLRIRRWAGGERLVTADEPAYSQSFEKNPSPDTDLLRYTHTSLVTPPTTYEYDMRTGERRLLKRQPVLGGFDPARYSTDRLWATAPDGVKVPVTLLHRKDLRRDGTAPLLQYGYGAYGSARDPVFDSDVFSLVDRGFVYAIAHVRGGDEMGRDWYEQGKLLRKRNSFTDFIAVTESLMAHGWAARDRAFAVGRSAGGLLVGAVVTMRPDLYRGAVVGVPFVDVVTTMLDLSIPLSSNELDEWGDPRRAEDYEYMLSYSPYDQLKRQPYPDLLVTTGLWDSQVQYFEPAKWVAKIRALKTGDSRALLVTDMSAGHGGKAGRLEEKREVARDYAFLLDLAGLRE